MLASLGGGASMFAGGCLARVRSLTGWESPEAVHLQITTLPTESDPYALPIARNIADWFRAAGISVQVNPMSREALFRSVLLKDEFNLFIAQSPVGTRTPDSLYSHLHSRYSTSPGWLNPFNFENFSVDELLEEQRNTTGKTRREILNELQILLAETQPFTIIGFPDEIRTARQGTFGNWSTSDISPPRGYLELVTINETRSDDQTTLRLVTTDGRPTKNLNPLAVEFRQDPDPVNLLYDSVAAPLEGDGFSPRLAESWAFVEEETAPVVRVTLREELYWHDGEPLTSSDIAFTHAFLADTTLDRSDDNPIPAPRYLGSNSLIERIKPLDPRHVEYQFVECNPLVALRAFTVPILPEHIWSDRSSPSSVGGIEVGGATEALVTNNIPPVGSGPLSFVRNNPLESLVLEPFDRYFGFREQTGPVQENRNHPLSFDRLSLEVVSSDGTAVDMVATGGPHATWNSVGADTVPQIGRSDNLHLFVNRSDAEYLVGYNTRQPPLTNPRFRHTLASLIDKQHLTAEVFDGYLAPAASPLAETKWLNTALEWIDEDPATPFMGSDGNVNSDLARETFRNIGYRYDGNQLISN